MFRPSILSSNFIHFISSSFFSSYIRNFSSLSFQNLVSIQDHFYLASVILKCAKCNFVIVNCIYVARDPFW